jgi:hypothetical protein
MDQYLDSQLEIVIAVLGVLLAIGIVTWTIRLAMKPMVIVAVFSIMGWLLFLNTM